MNHSFNVEIAKQYGINEAIMLENLCFWVAKNKANNRHLYDGEYWTYNSQKAFTELFPYWNRNQIQRILSKLEVEGLIKKGNYNKAAYDRTLWYTLTEKSYKLFNINIVQNQTIENINLNNGKCENEQPIPDINSDVKTNISIEQVNKIWNLYPKKKGKGTAITKIPKLIKKYGYEQIERCIQRYTLETKGKDIQYIKEGSTFFNTGYVDYLDENYKPENKPQRPLYPSI